ncbi:MAG: OmpL47-type beta-barrel domain-containing protein, partial [Halobacteriales archaeon]
VNATGNHTVTAAATDLAGNRELALANFTVVDLEPPNTTLLVDPSMPDGENGWYQTRPEFRLEPTLENATPQYRIDDGELQTYDGPVQVPEGNHTITYRSTHPIRPNELFNETQFRVDIEPPRTNATAPTGWVNRTVNVTLTASDAISGVNRTTWRLDDGDLRTYEGSVRVETEGIHEIRYRSHDLAGIRERIRNVTVRVDRTVPVVEASVSGNRTSDGEFVEAATVEVNASDALAGLNRTRVRVDGGAWRTYDGPIHVNATGNHTVTAAATDLAGNRELAVVQFTVGDREPPSTRLIADPSTPDGENGWYQTRPEFRLEPTPENATPQYRIDDGELQTYESPVQVPEGNHTIAYRSVHPIRPNESFNETQFRVDRTVPVVEASVSGDRTSNGEFANAATVEVNASDALAGLNLTRVRVDGGAWRTYDGPIHVNATGNHTVTAAATDLAGNRELAVVQFTVGDREPPSTRLIADPSTPDGENGWYQTRPEFRLEPTPENATPEYRLDDDAFQVYKTPVQIPEGIHTVAYRSTHPIRPNESVKEAQFRVDTEPPRTNATAPAGWVNRTANVTLTASDATSGVNRTTWRLNDGDLRTYEGSVRVELEGIHEIRYRSRDLAGNRERERNVTVRIDRTAPVVEASVSGNRTSDGEFVEAATVEVNASDALAGLNRTRVRVDGGAWRTYDGPIHVNATGNHTVTVEATDIAGNRERTMVEFTVACPDGEVYRDGACEPANDPASEPRVEVQTQDGNTVVVAVENVTGGDIRLVAVHPNGSEEPVGTGQSATWNTSGFENGRYRIEARNETNVTVASASYLIERARVSTEAATFAVGLGVVLSALVQSLSIFSQSFSVLGQSTTGLSGRVVRFVDLVVRVVRRILSIEYREYTKDTATIRRVRQTLAVGVAGAALASASTLAGFQPWTLSGFLSNLPTLGGAALLFSGVWYGGDWLVGQLIDEDPEYVLLGSGMVSLLATTILFRSPFGTPGYVDRSSDTPASGSVREREEAIRALADLGLVAVAALAFLPAMRLWIYGFGETGLLLVVMTLSSGSVPVPPLPNYRVWRWNKPAGLCVFALGIVLYVSWQLAVLPDALVVGVGLGGVVAVSGFVNRERRRRDGDSDRGERDAARDESDSDRDGGGPD